MAIALSRGCASIDKDVICSAGTPDATSAVIDTWICQRRVSIVRAARARRPLRGVLRPVVGLVLGCFLFGSGEAGVRVAPFGARLGSRRLFPEEALNIRIKAVREGVEGQRVLFAHPLAMQLNLGPARHGFRANPPNCSPSGG